MGKLKAKNLAEVYRKATKDTTDANLEQATTLLKDKSEPSIMRNKGTMRAHGEVIVSNTDDRDLLGTGKECYMCDLARLASVAEQGSN